VDRASVIPVIPNNLARVVDAKGLGVRRYRVDAGVSSAVRVVEEGVGGTGAVLERADDLANVVDADAMV